MADINQQDQFNPVSDFVTSPFKVGTYASMYASWPGMWSTQKGIWVPGIGRTLEKRGLAGSIKRGGKLAATTIKRHGILKGSAMMGGEAAKRAYSFGFRGGGFVGEKFLNAGNVGKQFASDIYSETIRRNIIAGTTKKAAVEAAETTKKLALKGVSTGEKAVAIRAASDLPTRSLGNYKFSNKFTSISGVKNLSSKIAFNKLAKIGLHVGKVGSMIGMSMFIWDIAKTIGEPLGHMAMTSIDNAMTQYKNRFMPETGGQLELSYLSQGAYTERQRALQAISKSNLNARSGLGDEASQVYGMFG